MRLLIHDFAGHPFQVQLSRELASWGHHVSHVYPIGLDGPKGRLKRSELDSERLDIRGVPLSGTFRKYSPVRRFLAHRQYARDIKRMISCAAACGEPFNAVLSGNTPIDVQAELLRHCCRNGVGFVHWVQDVYCRAIEFFLRRKFGPFAGPLSYPFVRLERTVASSSDAAIVIAPAFAEILAGWRVPEEKISVIENWAPLDEIRPLPRANEWSARHGLGEKTVFLYSGTLGMKHRPDLLYHLAQSLDKSCILVVITEGIGRDYLEKMPPLKTLKLLDFQPYDQVPLVLASADVLLATLESDAGQFAVPSKVLTYLCAGRPLLLAAPEINLAATIIERSCSGFVADPDRPEEFVAAAMRLAADTGLRSSLAANARRYAEREFEITRLAQRFEAILLKASPSIRSVAVSSAPSAEPPLSVSDGTPVMQTGIDS
jgi:glycosyltransferase involved in cell wall biosynthesis